MGTKAARKINSPVMLIAMNGFPGILVGEFPLCLARIGVHPVCFSVLVLDAVYRMLRGEETRDKEQDQMLSKIQRCYENAL